MLALSPSCLSTSAYLETVQQQPRSATTESTYQRVASNAVRVYQQLPHTPVRTAFLHELTDGLPVKRPATALGIHHTTVSRASEYCDRNISMIFFLILCLNYLAIHCQFLFVFPHFAYWLGCPNILSGLM